MSRVHAGGPVHGDRSGGTHLIGDGVAYGGGGDGDGGGGEGGGGLRHDAAPLYGHELHTGSIFVPVG